MRDRACVARKVLGHLSALQPHFTLTSASCLNLVERRFGLITARAIRRGSFDCVRRLEQVIPRYRTQWNETTKRFRRTKSAAKIRRSIRNAKLICETPHWLVVRQMLRPPCLFGV